MKNDEKRNKIQDEELKMFTRNGGYFHINISNSLVLLEKYRVSVDTPITVSNLKNKPIETDCFSNLTFNMIDITLFMRRICVKLQ